MKQINLILEQAARLVELHQAIKQNPRGSLAFEQALAKFNLVYDQLAFPGGLQKALDLLKQKNTTIIPQVITYLQADPWYFRSGYHKKEILHLLKNIDLTNNQIIQLQDIIIKQLKSKYLFYLEYARLARKIQDPVFIAKLQDIIAVSQDLRELRRAKKMLLVMQS